MLGKPRILSLFLNSFNKFNKTCEILYFFLSCHRENTRDTLHRLQQIRVLKLWLGPLALTLLFPHVIFLIGQLRFITRIRSLNFGNNCLPSALMILSILDHIYVPCYKNFEWFPERQHSFYLS